MRIGKKEFARLLLAGILMVSFQWPVQASAETKPVTISINNESEQGFSHSPMLLEGSVFVPLRETGTMLGYSTTWIPEGKRIVIQNPDTRIELKLGSKEALVNGAKHTLIAAPHNRNGTLYVPIRFIAKALGANVVWNAKERRVDLNMVNPFLYIYYGYAGYWLDRSNGKLYVGRQDKYVKLVADTKAKINGNVMVMIESLSNDSVVLKFQDNYGERNNNNDIYKMVLDGNDRLTLDTIVQYSNHPVRPIDWSFTGSALLLDGSILYEVNHAGVQAKHDLSAITGYEDTSFQVEFYDDNYMVVRPHTTGWLTLVNRKTNETVRLAEVLLDKEKWEIYASFDKNDPLFEQWDGLHIVTRNGNKLELGYYSFSDNTSSELVYKLN